MGRLRRAASAENHEIVARHLNAIASACIARSRKIVLNTALAFAVKNAQYRHAQDLLIAGADANLQLRASFSILDLAIFHNSQDCHSLLLKHGANPSTCGQRTWFFPLLDTNHVDDILQRVPKVGNPHSPLTYAMKLNHREIARDFLQAGAVKDNEKEDLLKIVGELEAMKELGAMEDALQREDPYLIYLLSFKGYYERHKEPILYHYPSLRDAFTISQAHFGASWTWPHLYQQDSLSREDFQAIWLSYKAKGERWPHIPAWNGT